MLKEFLGEQTQVDSIETVIAIAHAFETSLEVVLRRLDRTLLKGGDLSIILVDLVAPQRGRILAFSHDRSLDSHLASPKLYGDFETWFSPFMAEKFWETNEAKDWDVLRPRGVLKFRKVPNPWRTSGFLLEIQYNGF